MLTPLRSAELGLSPQRARLAIGLVVVGALVLRLIPLLLPGGPLAYVVNYDEGTYFSASALLMRGVLPYRDFIFVHPPGLLVLLAPITSWARSGDVTAALAATRYLATLVGAANAALAGAVALRAFGPLAGVSAALLYATFPEAVREERGPFLEPVLNLACLAMAWVWLRAGSRRQYFAAGLLGGLALSVKTWSAIWLVAALAALPRGRRLVAGAWFLAGMAAALGLLVLPFALAAPRDFLAQVVGFHLVRGPQGVNDVLPRLVDMNLRHPITSILALTGFALVVAALRKGNNSAGRFFALVLALTVASFLVAPIYFHRYASFVAPSAAVLGGLGVACDPPADARARPLGGPRPGNGSVGGWVAGRLRPSDHAPLPGARAARARRGHPRDRPQRRPAVRPGAGLGPRRGAAAGRTRGHPGLVGRHSDAAVPGRPQSQPLAGGAARGKRQGGARDPPLPRGLSLFRDGGLAAGPGDEGLARTPLDQALPAGRPARAGTLGAGSMKRPMII